jgi:hypothetical protein
MGELEKETADLYATLRSLVQNSPGYYGGN